MKKTNLVVIFLTLLTLLAGTISLLQVSFKIVTTGTQLIIINDNIRFYNEQTQKTDAMTEEYLKNDAARKELYTSEDLVVHLYSNSHKAVKFVVLSIALISFVIIPLVTIRNIVFLIRYNRRKRHKAKQLKKLQQH